MRRAIVRTLLVITTLVGLAVTAETVRSLFVNSGGWTIGRLGATQYTTGARRGNAYVASYTSLPDVRFGLGTPEWQRQQAKPYEDSQWAGFRLTYGELFVSVPGADGTLFKSRVDVRTVAAPGWLIGPALLAWPTSVARRRLERRRSLRARCCAHCGYDRSASPDGCPACGAGT
jgi:hypothetical protein